MSEMSQRYRVEFWSGAIMFVSKEKALELLEDKAVKIAVRVDGNE